jgi:hypothetical protein
MIDESVGALVTAHGVYDIQQSAGIMIECDLLPELLVLETKTHFALAGSLQ